MEGDGIIANKKEYQGYFNPLPPHGGRPCVRPQSSHCLRYFNPLPPHGGRLASARLKSDLYLFQSTPSAWRETHKPRQQEHQQHISIHSLRMEGDLYSDSAIMSILYFNPLPPHGGRQTLFNNAFLFFVPFQSTPSAWRETNTESKLN